MRASILFLTFFLTFSTVFSTTSHFLSDDFIEILKNKATTWTPRRNFPITTPVEHLKRLASLKGRHPTSNFSLPLVKHDLDLSTIDENFDSRVVWPQCPTLLDIRDQGSCGGCWAFAAVEVMSDRLCIATNGTQQFIFSPEELISCCSDCGFGCVGGYLLPPYQYWVSHGIPSGSDQDSGIGCRPYTAHDSGLTPICNQTCTNGQNYNENLRYGFKAYEVSPTVLEIQKEISMNGPVGTLFQVYQDFYSYGSGIYQYTYGDVLGWHAVKIIGWGVEDEIPYWIVANSWGTSWGENGFFRIVRGSNECNIESSIAAGMPKTTSGGTICYKCSMNLLFLFIFVIIVVINK